MTKQDNQSKILIQGVTTEGKEFRPSDWAYRMSDRLATYKNQRIKYSPLLQPTHDKNGYKCVLIDPTLKESNPNLYKSILDFAKKNKLKICKEED